MYVVDRKCVDACLAKQKVNLRPVVLTMKNQVGADFTKAARVGDAFRVLINEGCIHFQVMVSNQVNPLFMNVYSLWLDIVNIKLMPKINMGDVSVEHPAIPNALGINDMRQKGDTGRPAVKLIFLDKEFSYFARTPQVENEKLLY